MTPLVPLALFGWWVIVAIACITMQPRRALLAVAFFGWLFLPVASYDLPGLPDYSKWSAVSLAMLVAVLVGSRARIRDLRFSVVDAAALCLLVAPSLSAISVGTGVYDAVAALLDRFIIWVAPYVAGRLMLGTERGLRDFAMATILGGLAYVPLCLFEVRFSPQLHNILFGYHQHHFNQMIRGDGFRPLVFLYHGLVVAIYMGMATVAASALWRARQAQRIALLPIGVVVATLFVVAVLCKSVGPLMLTMFGLGIVFLMHRPAGLAIWRGVLFASVAYVMLRATGIFDGAVISEFLADFVSPERIQSLDFRFDAERTLVEKGLERPFFGWTPYYFQTLEGTFGEQDERVITDSRWLIEFAQHGFFGLFAFMAINVLAISAAIRRLRGADLRASWYAPVVAVALIATMEWFDKLVNGAENQLALMGLGALATFAGLGSQRAAVVDGDDLAAREMLGDASPQSAVSMSPGEVPPRTDVEQPRVTPRDGRGDGTIRSRRARD